MAENNVNIIETVGKKRKAKGMNSMRMANRIFLISMLILPIIHWCVSWLFVNIQSILMAFQLPTGDWSLLNFTVLKKNLTDPNSDIVLAIANTLKWFVFQDCFMFPFTIILNYFFYKKMPGYKLYRILLYVPGLLSGVAVSSMIKRIVLPSGPLGVIFNALGVEEVPLFFTNPEYANKAMFIYSFWLGWGGSMLLLGGTYARIPAEVLEAAKLDGCGPVRELVQLIIPMISSTLITMIILRLTGIFSASGPLFLFTQGKYGTMTLSYWIFDSVRFGGASTYNTVAATGLVFTCIAVPLILTVRWLLEKIPVVEY